MYSLLSCHVLRNIFWAHPSLHLQLYRKAAHLYLQCQQKCDLDKQYMCNAFPWTGSDDIAARKPTHNNLYDTLQNYGDCRPVTHRLNVKFSQEKMTVSWGPVTVRWGSWQRSLQLNLAGKRRLNHRVSVEVKLAEKQHVCRGSKVTETHRVQRGWPPCLLISLSPEQKDMWRLPICETFRQWLSVIDHSW